MQFKVHFFFPVEKVYSYNKISVDVLTPAGRLLVSNGLWRLKVCASVSSIHDRFHEMLNSDFAFSTAAAKKIGVKERKSNNFLLKLT